jgi:hypothetical protein
MDDLIGDVQRFINGQGRPDRNVRKPNVRPGATVRWCPRCGVSILPTARVLARMNDCKCGTATVPWSKRFEASE